MKGNISRNCIEALKYLFKNSTVFFKDCLRLFSYPNTLFKYRALEETKSPEAGHLIMQQIKAFDTKFYGSLILLTINTGCLIKQLYFSAHS